MKAASSCKRVLGLFVISFIISFLITQPRICRSQENDYYEGAGKFTQEELAQMLAPIALYPDVLLSQVLMASTYPLEVIEADRWIKKNPALSDQALDDALLDMDWDPSVKALCHFPSILARMSERISETTTIGNAFLAQEDEVMDMVQDLRARAYAQGNLNDSTKQKVIVEKQTIVIEPADPHIIYVPYYDPYTIYGPWWYPAYPPYYWGPPGVRVGFGISYWPGTFFGFSFGSWSYFDWHQHYIYIDVHKRPRFVRSDRWSTGTNRWSHLTRHRRGVAYRDKSTARRFNQFPYRGRVFRPDTRGFPESSDRDRNRRFFRDPDTGGKVRRQIDGSRQKRSETVPEVLRQPSEKPDRQRPAQTGTVPERQEQQSVEPENRLPQRPEWQRKLQGRIERQKQQKSRENVFNPVENGRNEVRSSNRGRASRQNRGGINFRNWSRSEDNDFRGRAPEGGLNSGKARGRGR